MTKITPKMEPLIISLVGQGISFEKIAEKLKKEYGITVVPMTIWMKVKNLETKLEKTLRVQKKPHPRRINITPQQIDESFDKLREELGGAIPLKKEFEKRYPHEMYAIRTGVYDQNITTYTQYVEKSRGFSTRKAVVRRGKAEIIHEPQKIDLGIDLKDETTLFSLRILIGYTKRNLGRTIFKSNSPEEINKIREVYRKLNVECSIDYCDGRGYIEINKISDLAKAYLEENESKIFD